VSLSTAAVLEATRDRRELAGYCSKILGSPFEADDAVQETMVRAWTRRDSFEGRSSVHSWVYRIATNVCLDMLRRRNRQAVPMDLNGLEVLPHDQDLQAEADDPADLVAEKDEIQLALMVALQVLPARQRAVLILREVLRWSAPEVADLLGTTVASVNSALQRARATLAARPADAAPRPRFTADDEARLAGYSTAFEDYDIDGLITLLQEDAAGVPAGSRRR